MEPRDDDPFLWGVGRVVQELCTSNRSWKAPPVQKLPDPDQLSGRLTEVEVDGEALLTFEDSVGSLKDLFDSLGIKKIPHQLSIRKAIKQFQARSAEYQRWKRGNYGEQSEDSELDEQPKPEPKDGKDTLVHDREARDSLGRLSPASPGVQISSEYDQRLTLSPAAGQSSDFVVNKENDSRLTPAGEAGPATTVERSHSPPGDLFDQPPKKKQRIAPTVLTTIPSGTTFNLIPTEADIFVRARTSIAPSHADNKSRFSYLGSHGYTFGDTLNLGMSIGQEDSATQFSFVTMGNKYPGHRLQVNKAMKRYLLQHSTSEVPDTGSDGSSDRVLPLFGESDDEYDAEVWREYEEEEAEREKLEALKKSFLSKDEIDEMIKEAIRSYEEDWNQEKKLRELLKANKLWNDARRHNSRQRLISDAAARCRSLDARINKISRELRDQQWSNRGELEKHMEHFELSVAQRQTERFRIQVLSSPVEPSKPRKVARPAVKKKLPIDRENDDEEVLTSDSDDGLDQFIIDDEVEENHEEEINPFNLEGISLGSLGSLFENDRQDDTQHANEEVRSLAVEDEPTDENTPLREDIDRGTSTPFTEDPMDIDQGALMDADGTYSPPPVLGTAKSPAQDDGPVTPATEHTEQETPASEAVDFDLTQIEDPDTPTKRGTLGNYSASSLTSPTDLMSHNPPAVGDASHPPEVPNYPTADDIAAIAEHGIMYWAKEDRSRTGLLIALLWEWPADLRKELDAAIREKGKRKLDRLSWQSRVDSIRAQVKAGSLVDASDVNTRVSTGLVQLYVSWIDHSAFAHPLRESLEQDDFRLLANLHEPEQFRRFFSRLRHVLRGFHDVPATGFHRLHTRMLAEAEDSVSEGPVETPAAPSPPGESDPDRPDMDDAEEAETEDVEDMPISPSKRSRVSRLQRRKRHIPRNTEAADIRETNFQQKALFEGKRRRLREELADVLPRDMARYIVNETKEDDEELIYINSRTRHAIKDHQVEGVRFMWNQIVAKSKVRQGCLLAHTMGLGKTMQVITLLVAIAEASSSKKKAVYKQIPKELRDSRTLILCPSGLVDNWIDELNIWTPMEGPEGQPLADNEVGFLGHVYKIEAALSKDQRPACVSAWQRTGGVLVMGYPMFLQLSKDSQLLETLLETPNMVIADEAHKLKSSSSQIHQVTQNFRASSRIAMTGSPLTNNVADYYHMVSWVAPNYLGPYPEFKQVYEAPVLGLHADSTPGDKRLAVKTLNVLRETVSPLVHRMGILSLKDDLPQKKEFILYLSLTPLQLAAYSAYLQRIVYDAEVRERLHKGMTSIWTFVNDLAVLLAHPSIYQKRLKQQKAERSQLPDLSGDGTPAFLSPDEEASNVAAEGTTTSISEDIKSDLLATVSTRDVENISHSWKMVILNKILDECRQIGDKVLVFSQHLATLNFLEEMFRREKRNWYRLDGSTHSTERQSAVKRFNDDGTAEVYLISTRAGGEGLNIHGANRVVIFDFKYVPMEEQQAVGRAYRIGQTKPVFVYWLIVGETFEESVQNRSVFKMQLASRVVDKKNPLSWSKRAFDLFPKDGRLPDIPPRAPDISTYSGKDVVLDSLLDSPKMGDSIRRIIMTETFEEEEPDDSILTTDDRKEISEWVAKNHQRGATAWAAGVQKSLFNQALSSAPLLQSHGLAHAGSESYLSSARTQSSNATQHLTKTSVIKIPVPEHLRTSRPLDVPGASPVSRGYPVSRPEIALPSTALASQPAASAISSTDFPGSSTMVPPPDPASAVADVVKPLPSSSISQLPLAQQAEITNRQSPIPQGPSFSSAGHAAASQAHGPRSLGNIAPIPGTGTKFALPIVDQKPTEEQPARQGFLLKDQGPSKSAAAKLRRVQDMLWETYEALDDDLQRMAPVPLEFLDELTTFLKNDPDHAEDMLLLDFCSSLIKNLENSSRFSMALLFGLIDAKELGKMKRQEMSKCVMKYDEMDETTFRRKLSGLDHDSSVRTHQPDAGHTN